MGDMDLLILIVIQHKRIVSLIRLKGIIKSGFIGKWRSCMPRNRNIEDLK